VTLWTDGPYLDEDSTGVGLIGLVRARSRIYSGLKTPQDINGIYTAIGVGVTLGGGSSITALRNQNGVVIHLTSTSAGLRISLAVGGMKIMLSD
jgi:hypothetical protein